MTRFPDPRLEGKDPLRQLIEECFRREAGNSVAIPGDGVHLIENGILDSKAWVVFLRAVESASGAVELGSGLNGRAASLGAILAALHESESRTLEAGHDVSE